MGIGNYDLRIDIQQTDNISEKAAEIVKTMNNDQCDFKVCRAYNKNIQSKDGRRIRGKFKN